MSVKSIKKMKNVLLEASIQYLRDKPKSVAKYSPEDTKDFNRWQ